MNVAISTYEDVLNSAQQLTDDEQARLIEDLQDSAWARDYEARKSSGQLTAEDLDPLPRPPGCLKLTGADLWRIRIGDYRVIYAIDDALRLVMVVDVGHRGDVYR